MAWSKHEGMIAVEEPEAMDEFFISPSRIPEDGRELVGALFTDWFLLERKLTRCGLTPLGVWPSADQLLEPRRRGLQFLRQPAALE